MRSPMARRRDVVALLVAAVTAFAGLTAWLVGEVDIGLRLGDTEEGFVQIAEVLPDSIAESYGFMPGGLVVELMRRDGSSAATRESPYTDDELGIEPYDMPGENVHFVTEWVPEREIEYIYAVGLDPEMGAPIVYWGSSLDRWAVSSRLGAGGVLVLVGMFVGFASAAAISRGWLGEQWTGEATVAGVAVAMPLMTLPLAYTGAPVASAAGISLAAVGMLPLAWSLADAVPTADWRRLLRWGAVGLAVLVMLIPLRALIVSDGVQREQALLAGTIPAMTAVAAGLAGVRPARERLLIIALGGVPALAMLSHFGTYPELVPLVLALGAIVAWRFLPAVNLPIRMPRADASAAPPLAVVPEPVVEPDTPALRSQRDLTALMIVAVTFVAGLVSCCETGAVVFGAGFGALVAFALRRGLMGPGWTGGAIPIACAVAIPLMSLSFNDGGGTQYLARLLLPAAGALPVAHFLAWRHPDPGWRRGLFGSAVGLAVLAGLVALGSSVGGPLGGPQDIVPSENRLIIYLALGSIALVPALGSAMADAVDGGAFPTGRLDLLAIGLTPGVAMTALPGYSPNLWVLGVWVLALVAWRRFTIAPLLGLAQRTQRQRDLAVAAVEAERARLAADLHDDALQQITALVRRLDAAGDAESADLARSVAERLRTITSDLRLPLLDDLGAGPALEWLVGRVRPLADGDVLLERADPERPPPGVELAVFRVAQEALANAVKHGATPITVRYRVAEDGGVSLSVDDSGPGIQPGAAEEALQAGHLGMANMQQRAQQIGALLDVRRWPAGGTHVRLEWRPQ